MTKSYRYSPLWDYLYKNASADYISAGGPPDPIVRSIWIDDHIEDSLNNI